MAGLGSFLLLYSSREPSFSFTHPGENIVSPYRPIGRHGPNTGEQATESLSALMTEGWRYQISHQPRRERGGQPVSLSPLLLRCKQFVWRLSFLLSDRSGCMCNDRNQVAARLGWRRGPCHHQIETSHHSGCIVEYVRPLIHPETPGVSFSGISPLFV